MDYMDQVKQHLSTNPKHRTRLAFASSLTLAYRNLYEQSDTGQILDPSDFVELLVAGMKAICAEAVTEKIVDIAPNPASINPVQLTAAFMQASIIAMLDEVKLTEDFAILIGKLLQIKAKPGTGAGATQ